MYEIYALHEVESIVVIVAFTHVAPSTRRHILRETENVVYGNRAYDKRIGVSQDNYLSYLHVCCVSHFRIEPPGDVSIRKCSRSAR